MTRDDEMRRNDTEAEQEAPLEGAEAVAQRRRQDQLAARLVRLELEERIVHRPHRIGVSDGAAGLEATVMRDVKNGSSPKAS